VTRKIGLSLGADLCWPAAYETLLERLKLELPFGGDTVRLTSERVMVEPFNLRYKPSYDVVLDRLTHWFHTTREWVKKIALMDAVYVLNNPWSIHSMEKHTSYCAMMHLGMPIPETWMIPPKEYPANPDLGLTLSQYAKLFDLGRLGEITGYPVFVKPYDGGGWRAVIKCDNEEALRAAYENSGTDVMHVQVGVIPSDAFVRTIGLGPQVRHVIYNPDAPLHDRYTMETGTLPEDQQKHLRDITLTINSFFGWEFNSCESMRKEGVWHPIDFANACPDSQVTSLHYHFPWLVKAFIRWSVFCATTNRPMRRTLDWDPYYEIAAREIPYEEKLALYGKVADERLETERFEEFCAQHLGHLDEVAWEYFGSDDARQAVRGKVAVLYPEHEIEPFTELFWNRIQHWRNTEGQLPS